MICEQYTAPTRGPEHGWRVCCAFGWWAGHRSPESYSTSFATPGGPHDAITCTLHLPLVAPSFAPLCPLCRLRWVPPSLSLSSGALLLFVDAWPSACWLSLGSFLLLLLYFAAVLFSLCSNFPHASDLRLSLALPWYCWSPLLCFHLFARSMFSSVFAFFPFSSIHAWDLRNWLPSLTVFPPTCSPDLVIGFTVAPPSLFPTVVQLWTGRRGYDLLLHV
jgi:hypothetical protein